MEGTALVLKNTEFRQTHVVVVAERERREKRILHDANCLPFFLPVVKAPCGHQSVCKPCAEALIRTKGRWYVVARFDSSRVVVV